MKVRVLFVVPSLIRAGAETQVVDLINTLDGTRFDKHLFTFEAQLDQLERLRTPEVTHHQCRRRYKFDFEPVLVLARLIDELQIDVVHCTLQFAMFVGWLAARVSRRRPPVIVAVHTTINRDRKNELLDRVLYRWLMAKCARVLFVCDAQRDHWLRKFPSLSKTAATVHNGLDISRFDAAAAHKEGRLLRKSLQIDDDKLVIAHVAGFRQEKGHAFLMDALALLAREGLPVVVLFAGDGELRAQFEQEAAVRQLTQNVRFLGSVRDPRAVYGAADIATMPSTAETFSLAMLEALALEKPVVATDVGGAREAVIDGVTGLLVRPGDAAGLASALRALLLDRDCRVEMGRAGRRLVTNKYTQAAMVDKTAELLDRV